MSRQFRPLRVILVAAAAVIPAATALGEYPLLEQLNHQTQSLYNEVQTGVVRVQLPVPVWVRQAAVQNDPMKKWDHLVDPKVRKTLDEHRLENLKGKTNGTLSARIVTSQDQKPVTTTGPSALRGSWNISRKAGSDEIVLESRGGTAKAIVIQADDGEPGAAPAVPLHLRAPAPGNFAPNNIGLILDDEGHVLVPVYLEKEAFRDGPVRMMVGNTETTATFVGSDEKTQVTILKMEARLGKPVRLTGMRPSEGSLVMLLNPAASSGRLALWTGGERDYGIVVAMDGTVSGIVRYGQFLGGSAARPVIEQLIKVGTVQRAIMGVRLTEIRPDDPARRQFLALADRPALRVDEVTADSLAEKAGLKTGDYILELGSEPVGDLTTWAALSARGGATTITILREGRVQRLDVNLAPQQGQ